jgi:hypothetical protein
MSSRARILSVAVATHGLGFVFLIGNEIKDWAVIRGKQSPETVTSRLQGWIKRFDAQLLLSQDPAMAQPKGDNTREVLEVIARIFADADGMNAVLSRVQTHRNKYVEAAALAEHYPELLSHVPKQPKIWKPEPPNVLLFEALSYVEQLAPRLPEQA